MISNSALKFSKSRGFLKKLMAEFSRQWIIIYLEHTSSSYRTE